MGLKNSPNTYKLSVEEKQFYADNGYLVVRGLFDKTACDNLRKRFQQIIKKEVPRGVVAVIADLEMKKKFKNPEDYVNKINMLHYDEEFIKYSEEPRLVDVISQLLEAEGVMVLNSMLINKPPGTPWHPPHQDMYHMPLRPMEKVLTTWTAIDEATLDNGCVFVIPGSHKANIIHEEHSLPSFINSLYFSIKDVDAIAPKSKWVALPTRPGDTVFLNSLLVHGSFPNITKKYRKAITCIYSSDDCEFIDVSDTVQEPFKTALMEDLKKRGYNTENYSDLWQYRSKKIQKSKL